MIENSYVVYTRHFDKDNMMIGADIDMAFGTYDDAEKLVNVRCEARISNGGYYEKDPRSNTWVVHKDDGSYIQHLIVATPFVW